MTEQTSKEVNDNAGETDASKAATPRRLRVDVDQYVCQAEYFVNGRRMICGRIGCPGARLRRLCNNTDPMTYVSPEVNAERQRLRQARSRKIKRGELPPSASGGSVASADPLVSTFFPGLDTDCFGDLPLEKRQKRRVPIAQSTCQARHNVNGVEMICGMTGCPGAMLRRLCKNTDVSSYISKEQNQDRRRRRQAEARRQKRDAAFAASNGGGSRHILPATAVPDALTGGPPSRLDMTGLCVPSAGALQASARPFEEAVDARVIDGPLRLTPQSHFLSTFGHGGVGDLNHLQMPMEMPLHPLQVPMIAPTVIPAYRTTAPPVRRPMKPRVSIHLSVCQAEHIVDGKRMICGKVGCPGAKMRRLCTNKDPSTFMSLEQNCERKRKRQADARKDKREEALRPHKHSSISS